MSSIQEARTAETEPYEQRFSLDRLTSLTQEFIEAHNIDSGAEFVAFSIDGASKFSDIAKGVEYRVFNKVFGDTEKDMKTQYGQYDPYSIFLTILDMDNTRPVGCIRLIPNNPNGIKTLNDVESHEEGYRWGMPMFSMIERHVSRIEDKYAEEEDRFVSIDQMADVGTLSVDPDYQGGDRDGRVSTALYHAAIKYSLNNGIRDWVMIIDEVPEMLIQSFYKKPLENIEGLEKRPYITSDASTPMYLNLNRYLRRLRQEDPTLFGVLGQGAGQLAEKFDFKEIV